jgi:hypothetical protein
MQSGMHKGTSAVGDYGLMPLTAQDIAKQSNISDLEQLDANEVQSKLKEDPELAKRLSETMASKLLNKNDEESAAYKWLHGQYSQPTQEELNASDRVRKFRVLGKK